MGICGPPPKSKKKTVYREYGKDLTSQRRKKLVTMLHAEKKKQRNVLGARTVSESMFDRPRTSLGVARNNSNNDSPVPKLNISPAVRKTNSWSRPVTSNSNLDARTSKELGQVVSEWTELMNADATAHHREHIFLQRLKKEKQKKFQNELDEQVLQKCKLKPNKAKEDRHARRQLLEEESKLRRAQAEKVRQQKWKDAERIRIQEEHLRIRRERIEEQEKQERKIEKQMVDQAHVEYLRQQRQHATKLQEKTKFLEQAMEESHAFKVSSAAALREKEEEEERLRKKHNSVIDKAYRTGGNHRAAEAARIRQVQDRLYELGKTWMSEKKISPESPRLGMQHSALESKLIAEAERHGQKLEKRKKLKAIEEHRNYLEEQIAAKRNLSLAKKKEEEEYIRQCKNAKYMSDQLTMLQKQHKEAKREKYAIGLKMQLLENEQARVAAYDGANAPMTKTERQMNASLLSTLDKRKKQQRMLLSSSTMDELGISGRSIGSGRPSGRLQSLDSKRSQRSLYHKDDFLRSKKVMPDSVIPPWKVDQHPNGNLKFQEFQRKNLDPHEEVLSGNYEVPGPNPVTGHWDSKKKVYVREGMTGRSIVGSAGFGVRAPGPNRFNASGKINDTAMSGFDETASGGYSDGVYYSYRSDYSSGNRGYSKLTHSFHPRKRTTWFDDE